MQAKGSSRPELSGVCECSFKIHKCMILVATVVYLLKTSFEQLWLPSLLWWTRIRMQMILCLRVALAYKAPSLLPYSGDAGNSKKAKRAKEASYDPITVKVDFGEGLALCRAR